MKNPNKRFKRPESVLVVVYTVTGKVLLLKRAGEGDLWQSVTGSLKWEETESRQAAVRELREETGLDAAGLRDAGQANRYSILPQWRHRYAPEVKENTEYVYFLALPAEKVITLNSAEHTEYGWYSFDEAASKVFSWTNREAILKVKNSYSPSPAQAGEGKGRG
ncbi:dihydroneopterin triphosphate diphosphatase [Sulfuricaulis limicola]|uniref:dihydroneopterin triphosphate diphosphatase n=1 Tax=Sulfuricaulis limicola TaxID=1620215 RepID=UPI000BBB2F7D|nr:dihydroneopterin triphosphate diphosphatase [Sulfuricaulis limicola]